jgi:PhzF family phenazine biosynthesis protein
MQIKIYQVDAFTDELFGGNPAAVCLLDNWLDEGLMQKIAAENNLAETAFILKSGDIWEIRWFTPKLEVELCGHATLASAYVLFFLEGHKGGSIRFKSLYSGMLGVSRKGDMLTLDFPADPPVETELSREIISCFDIPPKQALKGKSDYLLVYDTEEEIRDIVPDFDSIINLGERGVIITAKGNESDFVSRFFAPQSGINEDPVTGSAHTTLTPYWSGVTGRTGLSAIQLSERKGSLHCVLKDDRVEISGKARLYLTGSINLSQAYE